MRANDTFGFRVPLIVVNVGPCLQPYPLLAFGEKPVVACSAFTLSHHCKKVTTLLPEMSREMYHGRLLGVPNSVALNR